MNARAALRLLRPKQWVKNLFVFAPLVFARDLFLADYAAAAVRAFAAFCLTASAVYIINDLIDLDSDRAHPEKRHRPLAAGIITRNQALTLFALLPAPVLVLVWGMPPLFIVIIAAYFLLNMVYSLRLKEVMLLDVFTVASGFMLRVLGGAYAIEVSVSSWLVLCSMFISLFLGFAKRRAELVMTRDEGGTTERKVLRMYRVDVLDQMLTISAAATIISYAMYTVAPRTVDVFGTEKLIYTTVFVIYGVFRYLYLIRTTEVVENPTNAVLADIPIIVTTILWIISCVVLIYFRESLPWIGR